MDSPSSFNDAPLDSLLEVCVHDLSNEALAEFVQKMAVLRSSAQTRKAALKKDDAALGGTKKKKAASKSSVDQALALLAQLQKPT